MNVCHLCKEDFETSMTHHYMMMHPKNYSEDPIETWPDGGFVFGDATLNPMDFNVGGEYET